MKRESASIAENETDKTSVLVKNISHYQPDELDDNIFGIFDDQFSLGERHYLQFANSATVEDLDSPEEITLFNMRHLEIFSIFNSGNNTDISRIPNKEKLVNETRLEKLKQIFELNHLKNVGKINETRRSNSKYLFFLCIREGNSESQEIIKKNSRNTLTLLRDLLITKNIKEFSIAKSPYIENIPWVDVIELIKAIFENNLVIVIVSKGTLQYVTENRRNEIFKELHASPIGGHRGVSTTFNRIPQNFYWENMKQDIQRRIQKCIQCQLKKRVRLKTKL